MNKIEKLDIDSMMIGMPLDDAYKMSRKINELIDAHNEMIEENELIKNIVTCREKLAEVDKKYNNL